MALNKSEMYTTFSLRSTVLLGYETGGMAIARYMQTGMGMEINLEIAGS